jgi:hypothetical protein
VERGAHGCKGGTHGREGVRMGGEGDAHGREGRYAQVMGRVPTGGDGGAHDGTLYQF